MFKTLFHYPRVLSRHTDSPLAQERNTFLSHLALQGAPRSTLLGYARQLRVIASIINKIGTDPIPIEEIARCAKRWAQRQRKQGRAQSLKWPAERFMQVACSWCRFMGRLKEDPHPKPAYAAKVGAWALFLRTEENLAESTASNYSWWARGFLQWLKEQSVPLRQVTLVRVDGFMRHLSLRGLNRVSLATAAKALRRFLRYAYQQGWCQRDWASAIVSPRLFRQESLPTGPGWPEVKRLIAATEGSTCWDLRNRAILLLLAVYGLRRGEVRALRLEDVDWTRCILRVQRRNCPGAGVSSNSCDGPSPSTLSEEGPARGVWP